MVLNQPNSGQALGRGRSHPSPSRRASGERALWQWQAGTPVPRPNSSSSTRGGPVTRHRDQIALLSLRAGSGNARTQKAAPPLYAGCKNPCEAQRTPLRLTPARHSRAGPWGPVDDLDVILGPPTLVKQPGRPREGASRVTATAPDAPFHARGMCPGWRAPSARGAGWEVPGGLDGQAAGTRRGARRALLGAGHSSQVNTHLTRISLTLVGY